jgi:hypothetical protein
MLFSKLLYDCRTQGRREGVLARGHAPLPPNFLKKNYKVGKKNFLKK